MLLKNTMKNVVQIIRNKRDGLVLTQDDIEYIIKGYTTNTIPSYQVAALLMAIYYKGMSFDETTCLMKAMMHSGSIVDLSAIKAPKIDKHSTGGVGDKVSLILAPLLASCGVCVPMISGRGLGHTGGTLDKLESIPGFSTQLTSKQFKRQLEHIGVAMIGQTDEIAPADKKIYALRDVTATVDSIPLIAASIMSKKLAEDLDGLVLDVKFGAGAFMREYRNAKRLAHTMVEIGKRAQLKIKAILTNMDNPLGQYIGNAVEVLETIEALKGRGPRDLMTVTYALGSAMLELAGKKGGKSLLKKKILSHAALATFTQMIRTQGGDPLIIEDISRLPIARKKRTIRAIKTGFIHTIDTYGLGMALIALGGGRMQKEDSIDPRCGFRVLKKVGDRVQKNEPIMEIHSDNLARIRTVQEKMGRIFLIKNMPCSRKKLIRETLSP